MYDLVLLGHSWLRWAALAGGVGATWAALTNRQSVGEAGGTDRWGLALMVALDLQMLLGLLLYLVLGPNMQAIRDNFGAAMTNPRLRFWTFEHVAPMLFAVVLVHVGRVLARKAATRNAKRKRLLVCFSLATILMIAATPWPGMANGRPLFRV